MGRATLEPRATTYLLTRKQLQKTLFSSSSTFVDRLNQDIFKMHFRFAALLGLALLISTGSESVSGNGWEADTVAEFVYSPPHDVTGFFGFKSVTEPPGCRFSGSFDSGLPTTDPTAYELKVVAPNSGKTLFDLSKVFKVVEITSESSKPFEVLFTNTELNCSELPGNQLILYRAFEEIGKADIIEIV